VIEKYNCNTIVFTGGEPLLQADSIEELRKLLGGKDKRHYFYHLETNGDLIYNSKVSVTRLFRLFDYVAISPKVLRVAKYLREDQSIIEAMSKGTCSIKVVTDMRKVGVSMLPFASMVMPLTTYNAVKDLIIKREVWEYCMKNNIRYSPRLHVELFGKKRGV
jgi:organic radical activating enzyme